MAATGTILPAGRELRPFTAAEVLRMVELGVLEEDEPVELLDGAMIVAEPQGALHIARLHQILGLLSEVYAPGHHVRCQSTFEAGPRDLPEPDLCVVRGKPGDYSERLASGADVVLVVEVAATSLDLDRSKARVYARAGVPVYWIVDLVGERLEVYAEPQADGAYPPPAVLERGGEVELPGTGGRIEVSSLLA